MWELTKAFGFESAHTLHRAVQAEGSRRIHGHSYRALVTVRGEPHPETGMIVDAGVLESALGAARDGLDHSLLDEVPGLGAPTLENLCSWIWRELENGLPLLHRVEVRRDSQGDSCSYWGPIR